MSTADAGTLEVLIASLPRCLPWWEYGKTRTLIVELFCTHVSFLRISSQMRENGPLFPMVSVKRYCLPPRAGLTPNTNNGSLELFESTSRSTALTQIQYVSCLSDCLSVYHATEIEHQKIAILGMLFWRRVWKAYYKIF